MCLAFFSLAARSDYPLVIAYNRDERSQRPALPLTTIDRNGTRILAGIDVPSEGTWLGISDLGRIAFVTDVSIGPEPVGRRRRAQLIMDYLADQRTAAADIDTHLARHGREYKPFNLVVGDSKRLLWCSNVHEERRELTRGVYGLGNAALNTPWPKLIHGRRRFAEILAMDGPLHRDDLFELMSNPRFYTEQDVDAAYRSCLGHDWEDYRDAIFLYNRRYQTYAQKELWATRTTTIVTVDNQGAAQISERTWERPNCYQDRSLSLKMP